MTIEQKALKAWGATDIPEHAIWILPDGTMLNGCQGGYVRDVDHAEVGQFFALSKFHDPGSNYLYLCKFIRRGNIRTSCDGRECFFELAGVPTRQQYAAMRRCMSRAMRRGQAVMIEKMPARSREKKRCWHSREDYEAYLSRYVPALLAS